MNVHWKSTNVTIMPLATTYPVLTTASATEVSMETGESVFLLVSLNRKG